MAMIALRATSTDTLTDGEHPKQNSTPTMTYTVRRFNFVQGHEFTDAFWAFGVILLEIGLWEPVLNVIRRHSKNSPSHLTPEEAKVFLVSACGNEVDYNCGNRFRRIIEMCLKSDFGVPEESELQINLQVVFRQKVVLSLEESHRIIE